MSILRLFGLQLGTSGTAGNNLSLVVPTVQDGTMKLAKGNIGATTQDILTVDNTGAVTVELTPADTDNSKKIISSAWAKLGFVILKTGTAGYIKFPNWLGSFIIQWGTSAAGTAGYQTVNYPIVFPTQSVAVMTSLVANGPNIFGTSVYANNQTYFTVQKKYQNGSTTGDAGETCNWVAFGF